MDLLATGTTVKPGLPARTGQAAIEGENRDESATFEVFLGLALTIPSPDADMASGPEGEIAFANAGEDETATTGNPAMPGGNILPLALPVGFETITMASGQATEPDAAVTGPSVTLNAATLPPIAASALPDVAPRALPVPAAPQTPAEAIADPARLAKAIEALPSVQAAGQQAQGPAPQPGSQATPASAVIAEAVAVANNAAPVARVLTGRQRSVEPARPAHAIAPAGDPSPSAADPVAAPTSVPTPVAATTDRAQHPAPASAAPPEKGAQENAADSRGPRAPAEPASTQSATIVSAQAEPIVPLSDVRPGVQTSGNAPAAPTGSSQPAARDFGDLMDRLVRAREAEQPEVVRSTLATRDFGTVSMQLRPVEGRLHVALSATDPGFAPAVQAASAMAGAGQQSLSDNSGQSQSQGQPQQSALQSGQGQSATPDSQARRQQWERAADGQSQQARASTSGHDDATSASAPRGAASGAIYA